MPNLEEKQAFLFDNLPEGREGAQCAFSLHALGHIFHAWAHYKGTRKPSYNEPEQGALGIIAFEKLGLLWCRLWAQLWHSNGRGVTKASPTERQNAPELINCPPPFKVERAKHGKRLQRYDGHKGPIPLADILFQQQEIGPRFFEIKAHVVDKIPCPSHYKTEVHPSLPFEMMHLFLKDFGDHERKLIEEIGEIIRHLSASEIRALGTHESLQETLSDVEWEYTTMQPYVVEVLLRLKEGQSFTTAAHEILEFADEAYRKSHANKPDYESGRDLFMNDVKSPLLKQAFGKCQENAATIWNSTQLQALANRSHFALSLAKCLVAIGHFGDHFEEIAQPRSSESKKVERWWNEGVNGLRKNHVLTIPTTLRELYDDQGRLNQPVRDALVTLVEQLKF